MIKSYKSKFSLKSSNNLNVDWFPRGLLLCIDILFDMKERNQSKAHYL